MKQICSEVMIKNKIIYSSRKVSWSSTLQTIRNSKETVKRDQSVLDSLMFIHLMSPPFLLSSQFCRTSVYRASKAGKCPVKLHC